MTRILLGVCGSSMAGSAGEISQVIEDCGATVTAIVMTPSAEDFCCVGQLRQRNVVHTDDQWTGKPMHIELADAVDGILVAPATINSLAKIAYGQTDNLLLATLLSHSGPTVLLPAANIRMWRRPSVRRNVEVLRRDGFEVPEPLPLASESGGEIGDAVGFGPEYVRNAVSWIQLSH